MHSCLWLLLGDFNSVLSVEEKRNGVPPSEYEMKDFRECCSEVGLSDLNFSGSLLTWNNDSVWCKLDWVMVNQEWLMKVGMVSLLAGLEQDIVPFKFYNMWTNHEDFQKIVEEVWMGHYDGCSQFYLARKLQSLKKPLKALNNLHFSHITSRAERASNELLELQEKLHDSPTCPELQRLLGDKRKEAVRLEEANKLFMTQEIRDALFSIEDGKSLGPYGYSAGFFKKAWSIVGMDVTNAVKEFFNSGRLLKQFNHTIIALVRKVSHANSVSGYRPISCCNVIYKIISKILAARIKPCLVDLINLAQAAFIQGRSGSGFAANSLKSNLFQARIKDQELGKILNLTGMCFGEFPIRYLGVPLLSSRLTYLHYSPLVNRISDLLKVWPRNTLSYVEKLEIINSIIRGVECFWLAIFPIPLNVLNEIVKLCRVFLWNGRRKPLVAWQDICLPKDEGGLGVVDLKSWNMALLTRALWNIHAKKDSLWAKWIHHNYLSNCSISEVTAKKEDSNLFKKLLEIRDQLVEKSGGVERASLLLEEWECNSHRCYDFWRERKHKIPWVREVWFNGTQPKQAFCLWLAVKERLPTCDKLVGVETEMECTFCKAETETMDHIFFKCNFSNEVWKIIKEWLGLKRGTTTIKAAVKWKHKEAKGNNIVSTGKKIGLAVTMMDLGSSSTNAGRDGAGPSSMGGADTDAVLRSVT
ncbi:uncharacterized protein LOC131150472 [Malania oleifera]|uniref:uncharacterized protein LOC131150472 n=1 Tax=Malania oleifera TaxID=397392 RepID=UPI0025AEAE8E|nr:uncharacterized protein LOC131150472 [Malania oleifera]